MPWEGGEIHVGNITLGANKTLSVADDTHVAGAPGKVSAVYPSWANNDTLIFTSDESGYINPWKYSQGKAIPLFSQPILQDFGHPLWKLNYFPYAILDKAGEMALFSALKDGRDVLYFVDLDVDSEPRLIDTPFVVIENIRVSSLDKHEIVFSGQKTNEMEAIVKGRLLPSQNFKLNIAVFKSAPAVTIDGAALSSDIISEPQPITLKISPTGDPLYTVYFPPHNPQYSRSSIEGETPPCIVNVHGGPTGCTTQGLSWGKQYFTSRGWAWYV